MPKRFKLSGIDILIPLNQNPLKRNSIMETKTISGQRFLATIAMLMVSLWSSGQIIMSSSNTTKYILPDGKEFDIQKLDSLTAAWGEGRVLFVHKKEDDQKNITWLVKLTDEMKQEMEQQKNISSGMINQLAPDFKLVDATGKQWHLNELKGKVVVLNFWFVSCAPCIQEMPELNKLVAENKDQKDVVFLGLSFNTQVQIDRFLKNRQFDYTLLANSKDVDKLYKVTSWPTSIVIDKNGTIKFLTNSSSKIREELKTIIESLLKP